MHPLQTLAEPAGQHRQQCAVIRSEMSPLIQLEVDDQYALGMLQSDAGLSRFEGLGFEQLPIVQRRDLPAALVRQGPPLGGLPGAHQRRHLLAAPRRGHHPTRTPDRTQLFGRGGHRIGQGVRLGQLLVQGCERGLPQHHVVLGGDVAQRPDDHLAARVGILGMGERRCHPQPMAVAVGHRNRGQRPVRFVHQIGERVGNLAVGVRITFCRGPPRVGRRIRQAGAVVAEHVGEGCVDLGDRACFVADEQRLLQRVDERCTPARVMVAHTCEHDVGTHPGQQFGGGERLDQIIVGTGAQPGDRRLRPRTRREQQHRHRRGPRVRPQRRDQPQAVQHRHHHIADDQVRRGRPHHLQCRASVGDRFDDVTVRAQQPAQIVTHVGVVVGYHHAHGPSLHVVSRGRGELGSGVRGRLGRPAQRLLDISVPALRGTRRGPGCDSVGRQVRGTQRKPDRERGALPLDAVDVDRPAVQSDEFLDQGQTDSTAFVGARP